MASRSNNRIPEVAPLIITSCLEWLRNNRERWLKAEDFKFVFGLDARAVRVVVNKLRHAGHPIVSGNNGYCYTYNVALIQECANRLRSQIRETQMALDSLLNAATKIPNNQTGTTNGKLVTIKIHRDRNKDSRDRFG